VTDNDGAIEMPRLNEMRDVGRRALHEVVAGIAGPSIEARERQRVDIIAIRKCRDLALPLPRAGEESRNENDRRSVPATRTLHSQHSNIECVGMRGTRSRFAR
jgi:hypothetical protein